MRNGSNKRPQLELDFVTGRCNYTLSKKRGDYASKACKNKVTFVDFKNQNKRKTIRKNFNKLVSASKRLGW